MELHAFEASPESLMHKTERPAGVVRILGMLMMVKPQRGRLTYARSHESTHS